MGLVDSLPLEWTFEVMQMPGGRYYVRRKPSTWLQSNSDLVALVYAKPTVKGSVKKVEFRIEDQTSCVPDNVPPGENAKILRVVRQRIERFYKGYTLVS